MIKVYKKINLLYFIIIIMGNLCCTQRPTVEERTGFRSPVYQDEPYYSGGQDFVASHSTVGEPNPNIGKNVRWQ